MITTMVATWNCFLRLKTSWGNPRRWLTLDFLLVLVLFLPALLGAPPFVLAPDEEEFGAGCTLPFGEIQEEHPIDNTCGIEGNPSASDKSKLQNKAKNNFCATGNPFVLRHSAFVKLQKIADQMKEAGELTFGSSMSLPADRSVLKDVHSVSGTKIGEGTLVSFAGFIIRARHSNVSKGESVNCNQKGKENNDVHVDVGKSPDADHCDTVTVEISPHFRPNVWDKLETYNFHDHPLRFTGQLFFDASHVPCRPDKPANPARISLWEIHPVYRIDVCAKKRLSACKAVDESVWEPLHKWVAGDYEEE